MSENVKTTSTSSTPLMDAYTRPLKKAERQIIGRNDEIKKVLAGLSRPELCNVMLLGEAGSGKAFENGTLVPVADNRGYVEIQDLKVGDFVFDENGKPTQVMGVYPQGLKRAFNITFADGSALVCNDEHLWNVRTKKQHYDDRPYSTLTLREIMDKGVVKCHKKKNGATSYHKNWYIPMNHAVERDEQELPIHPYALGALIGDGCLTDRPLAISSHDIELVKRVGELIGAVDVAKSEYNNSWNFIKPDATEDAKYIRTHHMAELCNFDCVFGKKSLERRIPRQYMLGSIEQRFELLRGLMDTDGCVTNGFRCNCAFSTNNYGLALDVMELAASLGMRTSLSTQERRDEVHFNDEYEVHFRIHNSEKSKLFWLQRHLDKIECYKNSTRKFQRHYDDLAIANVTDLGYESDMTCIYVESDSHLFQVGKEHIVTHNTALVQAVMVIDKASTYLEVDLSKMIADCQTDVNEMAAKLKMLFDEVEDTIKKNGKKIVLFIDEFHQIIQLSAAAVEALKPLLADSGTRGIKVIAATTYREFREFVSPNQALVERLQRINVAEPTKEVVISILRGMAKRYEVDDQFKDDTLFELIYDLTNQYIPANAQPRKSILILDAMIGWNKAFKKPLNRELLEEVFMQAENVAVSTQVDANNIATQLKQRVLAQELAVACIEQRLHISIADMNDDTKPKASFLFTGSTGVGKSTTCSTVIPVYTQDGVVTHKLAGEVEAGDYVFDREGNPTKVLGVFPQGQRDVYRVTLGDGRTLDVSDNHLWAVFPAKRARDEGYTIYSTQTLLNKGLETKHHNRVSMKYHIPMNKPVQWPDCEYVVDPYVMGVFIGNGCLTMPALELSSNDEFVVHKVANLIGAKDYKKLKSSYSWNFYMHEYVNGHNNARIQTKELFGDMEEIFMKKSHEKRIPRRYMTGSIEQRWRLIQGLFDTDGTIGQCDGDRFNVSYSSTSKGLVDDIQEVLYSLGVSSSINTHTRECESPDSSTTKRVEYDLHVKSTNADKYRYFSLPRKVEIAQKAIGVNKQREKTFDYVGIRNIEKLDYQEEMVCFYVDNEEHLYQAGQYVVTHNTEMTKQMAKLLFNDERRLIRFDCTEFANPNSMERFRRELTSQIWTRPYSIVLLDEIEKACAEVTRLLLGVLDDGRLLDENNREVTFNNAYIILTTNAASEIYETIAQYQASDTGDGSNLRKYDALIRRSIISATGDNKFPPELLGRIDCIVPFQPLSEKTQMEITRMRLEKIKKRLKDKHDITMLYTEDVITYLVKDTLTTDSNSGGARAIMNKLNAEVVSAISEYINKNPNAKRVGVTIAGEMAAVDKNRLVSAAYVKVGSA